MKINDIVTFSKENFFNGAVQTEWFYDNSKLSAIAESYVFHGPKYYGVSSADVAAGEHRLIDTASFAKNLTDKLYNVKIDNSFIMTIAGYGTGKSHLAVCLGALFSGNKDLVERVTRNICAADAEVGQYIQERNTRRNLVIVLNGMNNFNLDAEILRCTRLALAQHNVSDSLLKGLTKSYDVARHFVENMFGYFQDRFNAEAARNNLSMRNVALKNYLISHVETDRDALSVINTVYKEVNGDSISWDRGLSAGDVLLTLQNELCGEDKPFNKILLLFDEFGRYIEYTAANPIIAGEASLQQIFEAIQTANGKIIFTGFIQSELKAYLSRIEKTANITRYIDRYRTACDNLFLSSNFETILANILKKSPEFERVVGSAVGKYTNFHNKVHLSISRWDRATVKKSVWLSNDLYNTVILHGCYPLHPITVWLLSGSHQWMQQRSTLAFASEMFDQIAKSEIDGTWLPYIYPIQIVDSGIFNEMLNSEEKGLVSSQYCMLYRDIMVKVGDKLSDLEKSILKAVLIINMGRMSFADKDDAMLAIRYCSNASEDQVKHALTSLEEMHGVVAFDEHARTYDLIAEANGFNEFKRIYARYRLGVKVELSDLDEDIINQLGITTPVETSFGQDNHISSTEWGFNKWFVDSTEINDGYLRSAIRTVSESCDGEKLRGILIYAYCHSDPEAEISRLATLYKALNIREYPVIILFLNDSECEILNALTVKKALQKFSLSDKERFKKHILDQQRSQNNKIIRKFTNCVGQRNMIGDNGLETYAGRINALCTLKFGQLFIKTVPFVFDGFENKNKTQAKSSLTTICVGLLNQTLMNMQVYSSLTPKDKNRVSAVLATKSLYSWKVFDDNCKLVKPENPVVFEMIQSATQALESGDRLSVALLFGQYLLPPYGFNENSLSLVVSYFIAFNGNKYLYTIANERLSEKHWSDAKGKLRIPEIKRICIQKNAHVDVDLVGDFCAEILRTTVVEKCADFRAELDRLLEQEGETDSNKFLVAQAKAHLDNGQRLKKIIYEKTQKVQSMIKEATDKFSIPKVVKALELIPVVTTTIEDGLPFVYSEDYHNLIRTLKISVKNLLDQSFLRVIQKVRCNITELSQFKSTYTKIAKTLRENNYSEYADAAENRIVSLENELLARQKYESSIVECEKDLALSATVTKYGECEALNNKLKSWSAFIEGANDLPETVATPLKNRLFEAITKIELRMKGCLNDSKDVINSIGKASSVSDLKLLENKLQQLLTQQLPADVEKDIINAKDEISSSLEYVESMPRDIDALALIIETISEWSHPHCWLAVKRCADSIKEALLKEEQNWVTRYITVAESNCKTMSPYDCTSWLEKTKIVPSCLRISTKSRYEKVRAEVEARLHAARVDGLLSMYDNLTRSEQEEFKKLISNR